MHRALNIVGGVVGIVAIVLVAAFLPAQDFMPHNVKDSVTIQSNIFLGHFRRGDTLRFALDLRNLGGSYIRIRSVTPSCGCTIASFSKAIIASGQIDSIIVEIHTSQKSDGVVKKHLTIEWIDLLPGLDIMHDTTVYATAEVTDRGEMKTIQGIFSSGCADCHVARGENHFGQTLYKADCEMCHSTEESGPNLAGISKRLTYTELSHIVAGGLPRTNMPAFSFVYRGPLSDQQLKSVVQYISGDTLNVSRPVQ